MNTTKMHAYTYACIHTCTHQTHTYACVHTCTQQTHTYACIHTCTQHTHTYVCVHTCKYVHMHTCTHALTHFSPHIHPPLQPSFFTSLKLNLLGGVRPSVAYSDSLRTMWYPSSFSSPSFSSSFPLFQPLKHSW